MKLSYSDREAFSKIMDRSVTGIRPSRMYALTESLIDKYVEEERTKWEEEVDRLKREIEQLKQANGVETR